MPASSARAVTVRSTVLSGARLYPAIPHTSGSEPTTLAQREQGACGPDSGRHPRSVSGWHTSALHLSDVIRIGEPGTSSPECTQARCDRRRGRTPEPQRLLHKTCAPTQHSCRMGRARQLIWLGGDFHAARASGAPGTVRLVCLECHQVVAAPAGVVATRERGPLQPGRGGSRLVHCEPAALVLPVLDPSRVIGFGG